LSWLAWANSVCLVFILDWYMRAPVRRMTGSHGTVGFMNVLVLITCPHFSAS
jgi:hypothetical protein